MTSGNEKAALKINVHWGRASILQAACNQLRLKIRTLSVMTLIYLVRSLAVSSPWLLTCCTAQFLQLVRCTPQSHAFHTIIEEQTVTFSTSPIFDDSQGRVLTLLLKRRFAAVYISHSTSWLQKKSFLCQHRWHRCRSLHLCFADWEIIANRNNVVQMGWDIFWILSFERPWSLMRSQKRPALVYEVETCDKLLLPGLRKLFMKQIAIAHCSTSTIQPLKRSKLFLFNDLCVFLWSPDSFWDTRPVSDNTLDSIRSVCIRQAERFIQSRSVDDIEEHDKWLAAGGDGIDPALIEPLKDAEAAKTADAADSDDGPVFGIGADGIYGQIQPAGGPLDEFRRRGWRVEDWSIFVELTLNNCKEGSKNIEAIYEERHWLWCIRIRKLSTSAMIYIIIESIILRSSVSKRSMQKGIYIKTALWRS